MTDLHLVLLFVAGLAVLVCLTMIVLARLDRSRSAEHDLRRRALRLLAGMTIVPATALYVAKSFITGFVAIAVVVIWGFVFVTVMRIVFPRDRACAGTRMDKPP